MGRRTTSFVLTIVLILTDKGKPFIFKINPLVIIIIFILIIFFLSSEETVSQMSKYLCRLFTRQNAILIIILNRMLLYRLLLLHFKKPFIAALWGEHYWEIFEKYLLSINPISYILRDPVAPYHIKYTKNCLVPKEGHLGQFPANFCVKLKGTNGNIANWKRQFSSPRKDID